MNINFQIKSLKFLTVGYLCLPVLLFIVFWVKVALAAVLLALLLYALYEYSKKTEAISIPISIGKLLWAFIIVALWVLFSGNFGVGFQNHDLLKISAIQHDLIVQKAPVAYLYQGHKLYLSAYLGYFLTVPLLFGKVFGMQGLEIISYGYTLLGVCLGVLWYLVLIKNFQLWAILVFIFFSGFEIITHIGHFGLASLSYLYNHFYEVEPFWSTVIDLKMKLFVRSNSHALYWAPQHIIGCWLAMGLFCYEWLHEANTAKAPVYLLALFFWSPFVLVGILPYLLYCVYKEGLLKFIGPANICLVPIAVVMLLFVTAVPVQNYDRGLIFYPTARLLFYAEEIAKYVAFYMAEVGLWLLWVAFVIFKNKQKQWLLPSVLVALITLCLPLFKMGKWNDYLQWAMAPSIFLLLVIIASLLPQAKTNLKIFFVLLMVLAAWDPFYFISKSVRAVAGSGEHEPFVSIETSDNFLKTSLKYDWPIEQSLAADSTTFFKYISK